MTVKIVTAGVTAGVAALALAVTGTAIPGTALAAAQPAGISLPAAPPQAPASTLPTAEELESILGNLVDPQVSDELKSNLVVGGLQPHQANVLDRHLRASEHRTGRPFEFAVSNIAQQGGPDNVSTEVTIEGSSLAAPVTKTATFAYQDGGWKLSQDAADELIEDVVGRLPG